VSQEEEITNDAGITIRKPELDELEQVLNLNYKLFMYETQYVDDYFVKWPFSAFGRNYFRKRMMQSEGIILGAFDVSAEEEAGVGNMIGYITGVIFKNTSRKKPLSAEIENMFVLEEWRGKGVGGELIARFEDETRARGVARLKVSALIMNSEGCDFYEDNGFREREIIFEKEL
jgi:GNAT superfamily N-acetyltransferase